MGGRRDEERRPAHDRQRPHRPRLAVAVAGGLPGGARDVPVGGRPDGRVPGVRLHLRLGARSTRGSRRSTRRCSSRSARASPRAAGRSSAAGGSSPTATSRPASRSCGRRSTAQRYLHEKFGGHRDDRRERRPVRPQRRRSRRSSRSSGMDSYVFMRPGPQEKPSSARRCSGGRRPTARACSRYRIPHEYCSPREDLGDHVDKAVAQLPDGWRRARSSFYGVGNHGGGPTQREPGEHPPAGRAGQRPRLALEHAASRSSTRSCCAAATLAGRGTTTSSTTRSGCYSAHSGIKRWNRRAENLLHAGGEVGAVARRAGRQRVPARRS